MLAQKQMNQHLVHRFWSTVHGGGETREAVPRRARVSGSQTCASLNSRLESDEEEDSRLEINEKEEEAENLVVAAFSDAEEGRVRVREPHPLPLWPERHIRLAHLMCVCVYE